MQNGTLSIVATPIGNLEDITLRALTTLNEADTILAEDTRVAKKLLSHFEIDVKVEPFHHHSKEAAYVSVAERLEKGAAIAFISDAGSPGISDPGNKLVAHISEHVPDARIEPIPGPSALTAALSIAGIATDQFTFFGFVPHKKGREKLFSEIVANKRVSVLFESPHRIIKTLSSLAEKLEPSRTLIVGRELTKKFETIYRGNASEILSAVEKNPKGEFVIIINGC